MSAVDNRPLGSVFPTRSLDEIEAYDRAEMADAFISYSDDDPAPGENRSASYRWAWSNARFDRTKVDDGLYDMRRAMARRFLDQTAGGSDG